jgi:hypothetical protein
VNLGQSGPRLENDLVEHQVGETLPRDLYAGSESPGTPRKVVDLVKGGFRGDDAAAQPQQTGRQEHVIVGSAASGAQKRASATNPLRQCTHICAQDHTEITKSLGRNLESDCVTQSDSVFTFR